MVLSVTGSLVISLTSALVLSTTRTPVPSITHTCCYMFGHYAWPERKFGRLENGLFYSSDKSSACDSRGLTEGPNLEF